MKQLYTLYENYNKMKTRSQTKSTLEQDPTQQEFCSWQPLKSVLSKQDPPQQEFCSTFSKSGLDVNIDFDLASKAWRANKKYMGDGSFKYIRNKYKENAEFRSRLHTRALDY
jgi:hypothetical protein